ncbi:hypothetical protein DFH09DRAFT_1085226 [Mycena vulgaris]|nr:hypothetical protein DFH09DRAFT_1085226 [Mycena vulgaris]
MYRGSAAAPSSSLSIRAVLSTRVAPELWSHPVVVKDMMAPQPLAVQAVLRAESLVESAANGLLRSVALSALHSSEEPTFECHLIMRVPALCSSGVRGMFRSTALKDLSPHPKSLRWRSTLELWKAMQTVFSRAQSSVARSPTIVSHSGHESHLRRHTCIAFRLLLRPTYANTLPDIPGLPILFQPAALFAFIKGGFELYSHGLWHLVGAPYSATGYAPFPRDLASPLGGVTSDGGFGQCTVQLTSAAQASVFFLPLDPLVFRPLACVQLL